MTQPLHVPASGGELFEDGPDHGRVLVSGSDTGGRYSLMEYVVAPAQVGGPRAAVSYGVHRHREIEETFLVQKGYLEFLLDGKLLSLSPGDFVRVPPGVRHGFANRCNEPAHLLVSFLPGGFEKLFLRHRTDQTPAPRALGFVEDAVSEFASEFEDHPDVS